MSSHRDEYTASPLVGDITKTLTERIRAGYYHHRRRFPSERGLMEEFGVSRAIIRKAIEALAAQGLVIRSPRCRTMVRNVAEEKPATTEPRRRSLGLWIWPSPTSPGASAIVQGICRGLDHGAYRLVIGNYARGSLAAILRSEAQFLQQMTQDQDIAGILLWYYGGSHNLPALQKVRAAHIPMVFLDRRAPEGFEADYVGVDNERAAEQIVKHLLALGHRRIAHITSMDWACTVAERRAGYRRALEAAGIPFDSDLVVMATGESPAEERAAHAALVERLLSLPNPPTAVFAVNDVIADYFMSALRARGLRIPDDMSVAGFDGLERWMPTEPFLTSAYQPFERLGELAVKLLLHRIETGPTAAYQHLLLEAPLHIHGSTQALRNTGKPHAVVAESIRSNDNNAQI